MKRQPGQQQFVGEVLVERQQRILEMIHYRRSGAVTAAEMARECGVSQRTVERDIARLRDAGLPIRVKNGPGGGYFLGVGTSPRSITFTSGEIAALIAALSTVGPSTTATAQEALRKLIVALVGEASTGERATR